MPLIAPTTDSLPRTPARTKIVWLSIAVLTIAYYVIEHGNTQVSNLEAYTVTGDEMAERAAEGDIGRRLAIPLLGVYGICLLLRSGGWRLRVQSRLGWLLLAVVTWCGLSIFWSENPGLTLRHFSVFVFCILAALGIAKHVTMRDWCLITLVVTSLLIFNGVRTEIALGTFHPLSSDYRFAGTVHPNVQAPYCATMALAAGFLASRAQRGRILLWGLCLAALALLLLTKSRTVCGALCVGVLIYLSCGVSWSKWMLVCAAVLGLGATLTWLGLLCGYDIDDQVANLVLIGRQEETDSLSGRVPLWQELIPHAAQRPLLGHGYLTFWSPQRIDSFSRSFEWTVPDGHCAYLDSVLDLGLIGGGLCVLAIVTGLWEAARRYRAGHDLGYGFFLTLVACRSLMALLESPLWTPTSFCAFVMVCGLVHLGFCWTPDPETAVVESPPELSP